MWVFLLLALAGSALGAEYSIKVPLGGNVRTLKPPPTGPSETKFKMSTTRGAKMILFCSLLDQDCSRVKILVWNGERVSDVCNASAPISSNSSIQNEMSVTIQTTGRSFPAFCQVSSTKVYMNFVEKQIDSSEHGAKPGPKSPTCRCGWTNKKGSRIVNGKEAGINEYPFPILLTPKLRANPFCGGSIITQRHALTASHCTWPYRGIPLSVIVGEHDIKSSSETSYTKIIDVEQAIIHEKYNPLSNENDISILFLKQAIQFSDYVGPVCLPSLQRDIQDDWVKVMGWGRLTHGGRASTIINKVNLKVIDPAICEVLYLTDPQEKTQICTYNHNKDSCQGDSGGPLVWLDNSTNRYVQVALVSYGRDCASTDPAVNTDVAAYNSWIESKIASTFPAAKTCKA